MEFTLILPQRRKKYNHQTKIALALPLEGAFASFPTREKKGWTFEGDCARIRNQQRGKDKQTAMDSRKAAAIFENSTKRRVVKIQRCGVGIANYVFTVSAEAEKFILRCSKEAGAYQDTIYWLRRLAACEIPVPVVLWEGKYEEYSCLILSYIPGDDIGNVYGELTCGEKRQIAKEVIALQRKVAGIEVKTPAGWTWNRFVDEMLDRAEERIKWNRCFDAEKVHIIKNLRREIQEYLDQVRPTPYLDDISTKNLLIHEGKLSGVIDVDWIGLGDMLTFTALTKVALLNMDLDVKYVDDLLEEIEPSAIEYKAFVFYCLLFCVDFMGERGMRFLDKTNPVNDTIIRRLNDIFDVLVEEWNECRKYP